jgi:AcrR family transcriptional regulator
VTIPPATDTSGPSPVDGRVARARRTRDAIVDACIALVEEHDVRPTAPRIAERAGVSVRSVFQHFDDLESLYGAVSDRVLQRVGRLVVSIPAELPLTERIERLAHQRAQLLEALLPVHRAANVHAPFSDELNRRLRRGHDFMRAELTSVFGPELAGLTGDERQRFVDALDVVLSWPMWETMRSLNDRSPEWTEQVMARMLTDLFAAVGITV